MTDDPARTTEREPAAPGDTPRKRVLFVDADQKVLDSLKHTLESMHTPWLIASVPVASKRWENSLQRSSM
jgi:hypothetical protein